MTCGECSKQRPSDGGTLRCSRRKGIGAYVWADNEACPDFEERDWARRAAERINKIGFVYGSWPEAAAKIIHEEYDQHVFDSASGIHSVTRGDKEKGETKYERAARKIGEAFHAGGHFRDSLQSADTFWARRTAEIIREEMEKGG